VFTVLGAQYRQTGSRVTRVEFHTVGAFVRVRGMADCGRAAGCTRQKEETRAEP
jgi:hypothetical protein